MPRKPVSDMSAWPSLTLEGNLIAPAMVATIDRRESAEQKEADYRIRKGLTLREEISTSFRVGQSHFDAFAKIEHPSAEATRRFVRAFLQETFGFDDLAAADGTLSFIAGERVPIVVVPPSDNKLDRRSPTLSVDRSRSPAFALQDYLNEHEETLWGLVTNGTLIRLVRDNASLTRPAYIEADLVQIFTNEDAASFAVLWLLIHRSRFGVTETPATDCALERWRDAGSREGEVARDRLAVQVQVALKVLGSGFLEASPDLAAKLNSGEVALTDWFNELLRLVYRLIFLMVAEDRNLLHPEKGVPSARKLYAEGYSLAALRSQCHRIASWDKHHDRYEGIKIVFSALAVGQDALALPALGGLFSDDKLPHLETARLRNGAFMEAIYRLAWLSDKNGIVPVNWRAMETEELGSVYESLLELQPQLGDNGKSLVFASEAAEQKGNQRKTTGSYYTPDSLVQALLDTALDPVLDRTEAEADDPARALLRLSVIDPACGSGHFLLAAARRIATRLARIRADGTPALSDFRHALRDVARHCLHGVDRNPMAVELTKVALWIETVDPGRPLGFFDAQIRCGDALLGVFDLKVLEDGVPDAAYKPLTGDDKETAKYYARVNKDAKAGQGRLDFTGGQSSLPAIRPIATEYTGFRALSEDTLDDITAKDRRFRTIRDGNAFHKAELACDLYVAAFLLPKTGDSPNSLGTRLIPTTSDLWQALEDGQVREPLIRQATIARSARAFHWPLEFPDVMQSGGFDVVLGNPPWEVLQLSDKEYFAVKNPEIAILTGSTRKDAIEALAHHNASAYQEYQVMKRLSGATNEFAREAAHFALVSKGKVNTFGLFAALSLALIRKGGLSGVILPAEILTSETLSGFLTHLIAGGLLRTAFAFENEEFVFPGIANVVRFCLLTIASERTKNDGVRMAHFLRQVGHMLDEERVVTLLPSEFPVFTPTLGTSPIFRSKSDFSLSSKLFKSLPPFGEQREDKWNVGAKQGLFNMTSSSGLFNERERLEKEGLLLSEAMTFEGSGARYVPLYEGKFVSHFDHRFSSYHNLGKEKGRGGRGLPPVTEEEYKNPFFEVLPRYWVEHNLVSEQLNTLGWDRGWLIVWRDIANAKVERTITFAIIPWSAVGDTASLLFPRHNASLSACLIANLNSLVMDYCARQIVGGTHMTYGYLRQLPVLLPDFYSIKRMRFVRDRALELVYTSHALAPFARDLGYEGQPFAWNEDRRANLRADLDAFYARAYGLTLDELRYILDPADVKGPHYPSETFRVLKEKEFRQHGFYRTQRLVLAAWDRMEADGTFKEMDLTDASVEDAASISIDLPSLDNLRNGAWSWPASVEPRNRLRYAAQYALWLTNPEDHGGRARFLVASLAEPALLTPLLGASERAQWLRLVGSDAQPAQGVIRLRPAINATWRSMFDMLLTSGQLMERADGAWTRGQHFDPSGLKANSADAQRAAFALKVIQQIDIGILTAAVAQEDNIVWARFGHGG